MGDHLPMPPPDGMTSLPSPLRSAIAAFESDADGATAVEFAFVAFPLMTLLLLVLEVGLTYWTNVILDNGVQAAARSFYTDTGATSQSMADMVRTKICASGGGLINCDRLKVDLSYHADLAAVELVSPVDAGAWRSGFGTAHGCTQDSRVVVVQAAIAQKSFHDSVAGLAVFADGSRLIQSATVVALGRRATGLTGC